MFTPTMKNTETFHRTRSQAADEINHAMARFPLIVGVLGKLRETNVPLPGDGDLARGCERALTDILGALTRIEPAAGGRASKTEEAARKWLASNDVTSLIDADQLQRMHQIIDAVLGVDPAHQ